MTNYTRGRALEYEVKHEFESLGYYVVRSAGSHGVADLIAIRGTHPASEIKGPAHYFDPCVWLIQCKLNDDGTATREKKCLVKLAKKLQAHAAWYSRNRGRVNLRVW